MIKNLEIFLVHILESIEQIEKVAKTIDAASFYVNREKQSAVVREYEIIGEAMKNIPAKFRKKYPQIPWRKAIGMRNKLIHEYFGVDFYLIWEATKRDLPELKTQIKAILDEMNKNKLL